MAPKVGRGAVGQPQQLGHQRVVVIDVAGEGLVAADRLGVLPGLDGCGIDAADAAVQPLAGTLPEPALKARKVVGEGVEDRPHSEAPKPLLESRSDAGDVGEVEPGQKHGFLAGRDDAHAAGPRCAVRLGALGGQLRYQSRRAAPDRDGYRRLLQHGRTDPPRRVFERLPVVQPLGPTQVEIHLVDRRRFDDRRESLKNAEDATALLAARPPRDADDRGVGAQAQGLSGGHARPDPTPNRRAP